MGWANCGQDSKGRYIGYANSATCDEPGCDTKIDRGLSYACGGMHGAGNTNTESDADVCEGYFCSDHREYVYYAGVSFEACRKCAARLNAQTVWQETT